MNERELRAFYSVANAGRMDLAAKELGYSQPAISYQIKCLEQSLGFKLFTRDTGGVRLTREGQMILPSVRALLSLIEGIRNTALEPVGDEAVNGHGPPP
jgi:DNA-binding transcriptional LysR family regulator